MELLRLLEGIRTPFLDSIFSLVTHLGSEAIFIAAAIIIFWCADKRKGYYLLSVGFLGIIINQFLKMLFRIPRPWVKDPEFTIVESARADADGYSFPSGHTQNAAAVLGAPARATEKKWLRILLVAGILLAGFSRMYLGVHTLADVAVSLLIGGVLIFGIYPLTLTWDEKPGRMYAFFGILSACAAALVVFMEVMAGVEGIDSHNLASGTKYAWLVFGAGLGLLAASFIERKYIGFKTSARFSVQLAKVVPGLALVMGLKAGLKPLCLALTGGHESATAIRYFLLVIFAVCIWPAAFRRIEKMNLKKALIITGCVILALALLAGFLFWRVTRETNAAPISTEGASNPFITELGETMLSGHRAGGGIAPENTMMALKNCIENGQYELDIFEFDLHLTADDHLVLIHDSTLDRTSDACEVFGEEDVKVRSKTLEELKKLNMGAKFKNDNGEMPFAELSPEEVTDDLRITTLDEALDYLEANGDFSYIIEIKNSGDDGMLACDTLYKELSSRGMLEKAVIGTFHNEITAYMDETYPDMLRSAGFNECIRFYLYSFFGLEPKEGEFRFVALQIPTTDYVVNLGTSKVINYAHRHNIAVQYWTINDPDEMARLQSIGADAVMTDVPDISPLNQPK